MKLSRQLKMDISKVVVITICNVLISLFIVYFNYIFINSRYSLGPSMQFNLSNYIIINIVIGLIAGILGGSFLVYINSHLFRKKSFVFAMLTTLAAYISIFMVAVFASIITSLITEQGLNSISLDSIQKMISEVFDLILITYFILWGTITLLTLFALQVNDKFGPGILLKFLIGSYHHPKKEERIFMFMDMRSSTTIAEKIGNEKYFSLLKDLFADVTNTILKNEGEIYQYVGDEIVISWPIKKGTEDANCFRCFFEIQAKIVGLKPMYEKKYDIAPEFKAGLHYGFVMAGEIGVIKKDVIYSGDVLNTTARIQEKCNQYGVDILTSKETLDLIPEMVGYNKTPLGSIELRGKQKKIDLYTLTKVSL